MTTALDLSGMRYSAMRAHGISLEASIRPRNGFSLRGKRGGGWGWWDSYGESVCRAQSKEPLEKMIVLTRGNGPADSSEVFSSEVAIFKGGRHCFADSLTAAISMAQARWIAVAFCFPLVLPQFRGTLFSGFRIHWYQFRRKRYPSQHWSPVPVCPSDFLLTFFWAP